MGIYDSLCDGPSTVVQGGGDNAQGFTARSLSSRAVALRHANASCKTWRYGQPNEGDETFWPEPVVELRDQGTGVLRALALVEKMGGSLDLRALAYLAVYLVVPTVCLFKAGLLRGNKPWSQVFDRRIHELDYFARGRNKVGGAN